MQRDRVDQLPGPDRRAALRRLAAISSTLVLPACGGGSGSTDVAPAPTQVHSPGGGAQANPPSEPALRVTVLNSRLASPWGMASLPDGRLLVTQKAGSMVIVAADGSTISAALTGVPAVAADGQGGLLDVALDPDFATDPWVYWSYAEPGSGGTAGTTVARGRLQAGGFSDVAVIFRQTPKVSSGVHFGSRLAFRADKTLFITTGDRGQGSPSQDLGGHIGKVLRIRRDGSVPADNPVFGGGARPELWSIGHRNMQGAAIHPGTGELWVTEHGPQGGDELNRVLPGRNHGWPVVSYGCKYGDPIGEACRIGGGVHAPTYEEPVSFWGPTSTAPSGLCFYDSDKLPAWRGNLFSGALAGTTLWRFVLDDTRVALRTEVKAVKALNERIRCVQPSRDGWLLMLTDSGKLLRLETE